MEENKFYEAEIFDRLNAFEDHRQEIAAIAEKLIDRDLAYDPVYCIDDTILNQ